MKKVKISDLPLASDVKDCYAYVSQNGTSCRIDCTQFGKYKGEVETYNDLPTDAQSGYMYYVKTTSEDKVSGLYIYTNDGWASVGGASLYQHNINAIDSAYYFYTLVIYNNDSIQFTNTTLASYLYNNGFDGSQSFYLAHGTNGRTAYYVSTTSGGDNTQLLYIYSNVIGVYSNGTSVFRIIDSGTSGGGSYTFTDTVIKLL